MRKITEKSRNNLIPQNSLLIVIVYFKLSITWINIRILDLNIFKYYSYHTIGCFPTNFCLKSVNYERPFHRKSKTLYILITLFTLLVSYEAPL